MAWRFGAVANWRAVWVGVAFVGGATVSVAEAQLAITEVMSSAAEIHIAPDETGQNPDFWELTNFATNANAVIDLAGFTFVDADHTRHYALTSAGDPPLSISPGESILFVCTTLPVTNEWQFRQWWGTCLNPDVKVRFYGENPGLSGSRGDCIRLFDAEGRLVDAVSFGIAQMGATFTYDTNGGFGVRSGLEMPGVCRAATTEDIGSPGVTSGPVPLRIVEQPTNQSVWAGLEAVFSVQAVGLPKPRYQWLFNGQQISDAVEPELKLSNLQPLDAGEYSVELDNGAMRLRSVSAWLTVCTNPAAPEFLGCPADLQVFEWQNAHFSSRVTGYPPSSLQWLANDVPLVGETNRELLISACGPDLAGTVYCVQASNALGSARASARLDVIPRPRLELTEVMANPVAPGKDWFELTNFDTNTIQLRGWHFHDTNDLRTALVVTQAVSLHPGQSVVFVEQMAADAFARWWGTDNLPPGLPIITYAGFGLGAEGEVIWFWNAAAEDSGETPFIGRSYNPCPLGVSLELFGPDCPSFGGCESEPGQNGAFYAAEGAEPLASHAIGSPGYVRNPAPRFLSIQHLESGASLKWRAVTGKNYRLWFKDQLNDGLWRLAGTYTATNATVRVDDLTIASMSQRFYSLEQLP